PPGPPKRMSEEGPAVQTEAESPFLVATEDEVEILSVQGADTATLLVGTLPVQGPLILVREGDVSLRSVQPAAKDNMVPDLFLQGTGAPMIWARTGAEREAP